MRDASGHDDNVALADLTRFAPLDGPSANFVGRDLLWIDRLAAGDKRCRAFDDIDNIRCASVDLGLAGTVAATGIHLVTGFFHERPVLREGRGDILMVHKCWLIAGLLNMA